MTDITITPSTTIRLVRSDDVAAVADILAAAFHDDPVFTWCRP